MYILFSTGGGVVGVVVVSGGGGAVVVTGGDCCKHLVRNGQLHKLIDVSKTKMLGQVCGTGSSRHQK